MKLTAEELQAIADDTQNLAPATFMKGRAKGPEVKLPPPQPAHGEPWQSVNGDVWDDQSNLLIRDARYDMARNRAVECVNKLMLHPDLSAVEVHSKETMDEVRELLDLFGQIFALQKPAPLGGWNWDQLASQSTDALTKLNP